MSNGGSGPGKIWDHWPLFITIAGWLITVGIIYNRLDQVTSDLKEARTDLSSARKELVGVQLQMAAMNEVKDNLDHRIDRIVTYLAPEFSARSKE